MHFAEGNFLLEVNMEKFTVTDKCFCFLNQGALHSIQADPPCRETAVVFHPRMLMFDYYDQTQAQLLGPFCAGQLSLPLLIPSAHPAYSLIYEEYRKILSLPEAVENTQKQGTVCIPHSLFSQLRIKAALLNILACLCEARLLSRNEQNTDQRIESIKKVLTYIRENYTEKIYIRDLAGLLNVNEQYFCRFFKQAIGKSPITYINEMRIKKSVSLLRDTDLPVMEVCLDCGFNNLGNFLREFKKSTGMTPLQYRKTCPKRPGQF